MRRWAGPALALVLALSMGYYILGVLIPMQVREARSSGTPRGNLSDLYPRWLGAKAWLEQGRDPYSAAVTRDIQIGYYGRLLDPQRPNDPHDQQGFAYPIYVAFVLAPTLGLPFSVVQPAFGSLLLALTVVSVPLWAYALRVRLSGAALLTVTLLTLGSFPTAQGVALEQLSLLVAALLAGTAALLTAGRPLPAGVLLALATIKPQVALPLLAWLALWTLSDWRARRGLALGFGVTMAGLLGGAEWLSPGWIGRFLSALNEYQRYTGGRSLVDTLLTPVGGALVSVALVAGAAVVCWRVRHDRAGTPGTNLALALVPAVTLAIIPTWAPYNQLLLLPAVLLLLDARLSFWAAGRLARYLALAAALMIAWPWVATLGLTLAAVVLPAVTVQGGWTLPLWTSLFLPPAVLAALAYAAWGPLRPAPSARA
ncbi:MAG: glycosyltransferase 87 family protein [Chloroflexota bacterium]|nr:glycosyltransferase 87 family protein [Chloroflexota bacterium]